MAVVTIKPTKPDVLIARAVAQNTNHRAEMVSRGLTWGADEKTLLVLATVGWVATRGRSERLQRAGNHALLVRTLAVGLSLTRMVVLAHWASDVVAGFALGAIVERLL